jgi:YD repeat-containing protein
MTDREKAGLRGPVQKVMSETYMAVMETKVMPDKPNFREENVYLADGRLMSRSDGTTWKSTYQYDPDGRLQEVWQSSGHEDHVTRYTYDPQGRLKRVASAKGNAAEFTAETYQYASDGTKTKIWFIPPEAHGPNVGIHLSIEGSELSIASPGAASLTTVYDRRGFPTESLAHGPLHELVVRASYICDEEGHIVEEKLEPGHDPASGVGDQFPEELRAVVQKVFASHFMNQHIVYKYDKAGNRIEMKREMGAMGSDTRHTRYDGHGNRIFEESESRERGGLDFDLNGNEVPETVKIDESRNSTRFEYKYDEHGNWTEQVQWSRVEPGKQQFKSMMVKRMLSYF